MKYIVIALLFASTYAQAQEHKITFTAPMLYPEGIAFDEQSNCFYIGSVTTGTIGSVSMDGRYKEIYRDKDLRSSFGMKTDKKNGLLWVCISDPKHSITSTPETHKRMARVIAIDLKTGKKTSDIDLMNLYNGKHFANDIAMDANGDKYITDSYSPVIYKINAAGKASVFAQHDFFKSIDVGLNGIVCHPDGYLLVAHNTDGILLKVDMNNPASVTKVSMKIFLPGVDGLLLDKNGELIAVVNKGINKIFRIASSDNWKNASIKAATRAADNFQNPTTATFSKNEVYVLNSKMNELTDTGKNPSKEFSIQLANFKAN